MCFKTTCYLQTLFLVIVSVGDTFGLPAGLSDLDQVHDSASGEGYYVDPERASFMLRVRKFGAQAIIVGGRKAIAGEAPYQLSLMRQRQHVCGATLILSPISNKQLAITAAHCVSKKRSNEPNDVREYSVRGGSLSKYAGQTLYVTRFKVHENYQGKFLDDIALIFLDGQFDLGRNLDTLDLPDENMEEPGYLTVSGWGSVQEKGQSVTDLEIVGLPVIDNNQCFAMYEERYRGMEIVGDKSICTLVPGGGKDACKGDSGGPAVATDKTDGYKVLAGIVSWGNGCAKADSPGQFRPIIQIWTFLIQIRHSQIWMGGIRIWIWMCVYMKVSSYLDWIATNSVVR